MSTYDSPDSQPGQTVKHVPELVPGVVDPYGMPAGSVESVSTYANTGAGVGQTMWPGATATPWAEPTAVPNYGPAPGTVPEPAYISVVPNPEDV